MTEETMLEIGKKYELGEIAFTYEYLGRVVISQDMQEITGSFVEKGSGSLIKIGRNVYLVTPDERGKTEVLACYGPEKRDLVQKILGEGVVTK